MVICDQKPVFSCDTCRAALVNKARKSGENAIDSAENPYNFESDSDLWHAWEDGRAVAAWTERNNPGG